ncbi:MAG: fumarate hydratase [Tateyamaria sp.]|jgi:fumarate hydratase class I|uniref:fumarate hydratase n=1 Tax=Tateyamaria sp. TaxID=1929288 RepID=UPI0032DC103F
MSARILEADLITSITDALQFISYYHPPDFITAMADAYTREQSPSAKAAIAQILINSRMCATGHRPICQDTGIANVFVEIGVEARTNWTRPLQDMIDDAVRAAWRVETNPLRASVIVDPLEARRNSGDNTPAMVQVQMVEGDAVHVTVSAKGGGSENKTQFAVLNPSASVGDWVVDRVAQMGAGWCPPGILGIGVGGSVDKAMTIAKAALNEPIDITELRERGPSTRTEEMRLEILNRVNALGIGAQGLGGLTTVLDVKIATYPTHAASMPVALIPNCAATRHVDFTLTGNGPALFTPPDLSLWPQIDGQGPVGRRLSLDDLSEDVLAELKSGETLLLSGTLYTGRDAAHKRMVDTLRAGGDLPVDLNGRALYYVGPVDAIPGEIIGPAGPTTSTRMDEFTDEVLAATGLKIMIGKAERGAEAIEAIRRHGAVYMIAVGGAAYLVAQSIKAARVVAYDDLGMEAIREFTVLDMPVTVAVDKTGTSIHETGPRQWTRA